MKLEVKVIAGDTKTEMRIIGNEIYVNEQNEPYEFVGLTHPLEVGKDAFILIKIADTEKVGETKVGELFIGPVTDITVTDLEKIDS